MEPTSDGVVSLALAIRVRFPGIMLSSCSDTPAEKVPTALADHVEKNNLQGKLKYNLFVGASSGAETENRWARLNMIERRSPHQVGKEIAKGINNGNIKFFDKHL
jgi:acyl-CoA hydrolase